jgi:cytochrome c
MSCKKGESKTPINQTTETKKGMSADYGKTLFEGEGNCIACHQAQQKIIGPSLQEIAKIYKDKNGSIVSFLREESQPIIDPSQYDIMKANFAIIKTMNDEELKALENYIFSFSKNDN